MVLRRFDADHGGIAATVDAADEATVAPLAEAIADDARRYVPVLTGALRASIAAHHTGARSFVTAGNADVDYAAYQEFGTSKMQAQPYLRPAAYRRRTL